MPFGIYVMNYKANNSYLTFDSFSANDTLNTSNEILYTLGITQPYLYWLWVNFNYVWYMLNVSLSDLITIVNDDGTYITTRYDGCAILLFLVGDQYFEMFYSDNVEQIRIVDLMYIRMVYPDFDN